MAFDWFRRKFSGEQAEEEKNSAPEASEQEEQATEASEADTSDESEETASEADDESLAWAKAAFANIKRKQTEESEASPATSTEAQAEDSQTEDSPTDGGIGPETTDEATDDVSDPEAESATETASVNEPDPEPSREPEPSEVAAEGVEPEPEPAPEPEPSPAESEPELSSASEQPDPATPDETTSADEPHSEDAPTADSQPEVTEPEAAESVTTQAAASPEPESEPEPEPPATAAPLSILARAEAERAERLERLKATAIEEPEPEPEEDDEPELDSGPRITFDEDFLWSAEVLAAQGRRPDEISYEEITWLNKLRQGLGKTRRSLVNQLKAVVGQGPLNDDAVLEIESLLLQADVGVDATDYIIESLQAKLREEALPPAQAIAYLKRLIRELLDSPIKDDDSIVLAPEKEQLNIWLMTGVNGAGKTTTIGKLAHLATKSEYRCLIAAADTFRAAAVQQVQVWGDRSGIEVISNPGQNTDPAAVVFDAIAAAQSRNTELLLVDTAGRLQNKKNLMDELSKVRRIIDKKAPGAKIESLLVLDATLGQNGLRQAEVFAQAADLSGVVLTKLDGTARGGVALAVVRQLGLPIRFIGAGEGIGDLRPFSSYEFVEALLSG